jgi:proteic killer suppression protein
LRWNLLFKTGQGKWFHNLCARPPKTLAMHAPRLARQLSALDAASRPEDMNRPGWDWHPLKSSLAGHWSASVNGNWRLTLAFENGDAVLVDYQDYH